MDEYDVYWRVSEMLNKQDFVLDIGCGNGNLVNYLARRLGREVVGLDISDEGFARALGAAKRDRLLHLVRCVRADAEAVPFSDAAFDAVLLVHTLHHLARPEAILRETWRVLKPRGKLIIGELVVEEGQQRYGCHQLLVPDVQRMLRRAGFVELSTQLLCLDTALFVMTRGSSPELATLGVPATGYLHQDASTVGDGWPIDLPLPGGGCARA